MDYYITAKNTPSDINGHVETLMTLAKQCDTITEFGTNLGVSSIGFLEGSPKKFTCYDIAKKIDVESKLKSFAEFKGVDFKFIEADTRSIEIESTDLLFIDTLHMYEQLKKELELHGNKATKFLVFHDTTTFGYRGEIDPNDKGLMPAINEFLAQHKEWTIQEKFEHNNGLLILKHA